MPSNASQPAITVDCIIDAHATVGEGAIWSVSEQALYWVDIPAGLVHRHDPACGENRHWDVKVPVGCFALVENGPIVCALTTGFSALDRESGNLQHLCGPAPGEKAHRFNDGTVDQRGRFIAGTMPLAGTLAEDNTGTVYSVAADLNPVELISGFHTINGMAFSPDGRTLYASDSYTPIRTIWAWDYSLDDGVWSNRRVFFDTHEVAGRPDGGAMDADGCYWMAGVGGWQLVRITPAGKVDMIIDMPVEKPTRIAFGGPRLDTLHVTSIAVPDDAKQPQSGGVFALQVPGVTGLPMPSMVL